LLNGFSFLSGPWVENLAGSPGEDSEKKV